MTKGRTPSYPGTAIRRRSLWSRMKEYRYFYLMLLPALIFILVFSYVPMVGIIMAFKQFRFNAPSVLGNLPVIRNIGQILGMDFVGLKWFQNLWAKPDFWRAFQNTLIISFGRLLFEFPSAIILALLMNEMRGNGLKRVYQTVYTFPHFLSWVLVASLLGQFLQSDGVINKIILALGGEPVKFLMTPSIFRPVLYVTSIWKGVGWGSIIYMATIAGIDPTLYEASIVDGANRWHNVRYITWPSIKPTVVIMLIMSCGSILNAGFDQIFNMYNSAVRDVSDILDTFIYRYAFQDGKNLSLTVASGVFKSVINFALLLTVNYLAKALGEEGLL